MLIVLNSSMNACLPPAKTRLGKMNSTPMTAQRWDDIS
jgi:hypothetical protein